jgi:Asp-tRNA(Asn)/Glu-tRNA(Gln) amidotransferase A subunit family amidase
MPLKTQESRSSRRGATRGALPRLRGRGEQGNFASHTTIPSLLSIGASACLHTRAQTHNAPEMPSALLTTASQARQRSTVAPSPSPPGSWILAPDSSPSTPIFSVRGLTPKCSPEHCGPLLSESNAMIQLPITDIRQRILEGEATGRELATIALEQANSSPAKNTYVSIEEAHIERQLSSPIRGTAEAQLLRGIPISVKDCFDVRGYRTSVGSRYYFDAGGIKSADSALVQRLRAVGATITGKTHLQQLAYGLTGESVDFGNCVQFDHPNLLTGGSSSGAAASVLEGSAMAAIGTDTGGSIRFPSSLCSLFGYRASLGTGSWVGGHHLSESFDTIGFLFRHLKDVQLLGKAILDIPIEPDAGGTVRIGLNPGFYADAEPEIVAGLQTWKERFSKCEFEAFNADVFAESLELFRAIEAYEAAGYHAGHFDEFEKPIADRLHWGSSLSEDQVKELRRRRSASKQQIDALFDQFDFLLLPVAPVSALENGHDHNPIRDSVLRYTTPASIGGLPTLALPNETGGCQLLGPAGGDAKLLAFATRLARVGGVG